MMPIRTLSALALAAVLAACSTTSPDVVQRSQANRMATVIDATVVSTRAVTVEGNQSGTGGSAGAIIGGVAGSSVGGKRESIAVGVLGAVAGAVVGNAIERQVTREEAVEILVQLRSGERRAIVQAKGNESFNPGDAVTIVDTGGRVRVTKGNAAATTSPATPRSGSGLPAAVVATGMR
jgi:outer membrane lipoprotein SlyB